MSIQKTPPDENVCAKLPVNVSIMDNACRIPFLNAYLTLRNAAYCKQSFVQSWILKKTVCAFTT